MTELKEPDARDEKVALHWDMRDLGDRLSEIDVERERLMERRDELIYIARQSGMSWQAIADYFGIRREAAHYAGLRWAARKGEQHDAD